MSRTLPIVLSSTLTAVLAATVLTACTPGGGGDCLATPAGAASSAVKVSGELGGELTVDATFPLEVTTTERSVLIQGTGPQLVDGMTGNLTYAIYNGESGEVLERSQDIADVPVPFVYQSGTSLRGMESALRCAQAGSRIVAVIPAAEGFGTAGVPDIGLEPGDSLVLVADVISIEDTPTDTGSSGTTPEGPTDVPTPSAWTSDVPTVDLAVSPPTVTIPDAPAPTELVLTVLQEGDGEVVPNPSTVTVDYLGVSWETKTIFDSSYQRGAPATFSTGGVIPGFAAAIVGQKVGSTVLVSIPPDLGYPGVPDESDPASPLGRTLVFLVHIVSYE